MREKTPDQFFKSACLFEASLILLAIFLGWIADINPFAHLHFTESAVFYGMIGTIPLFILFQVMQHLPYQALQKIRRLLLETLGPSLKHCNWADLMVLASIAGIAEEILFRGVLQPWFENHWGLNGGLLLSNLIFGLVHAVTPIYFVIATLVGIYLGLSLDYDGERNLLIPIIIHGFYDFLAFLVIMRAYKNQVAE
jgi:membrane protease YdiL (CAAX protease family)